MNCVIVDDDLFSRDILTGLVKQTKFLDLIGCYSSPVEASEFLNRHPVDLLFLDMEMPQMNGIELIRSLKHIPQVILITSHDRYAVEAFNHDIADYIIKPPTYPRFLKAVYRAQRNLKDYAIQDKKSEDIFIKVDSALLKIKAREILWIEALGDYVIVHTVSKSYTVYSTLQGIESSLPAGDFVRVHRSFVVRLDRITAIDDFILTIDEKHIPIGKSYKERLMTLLTLV